MPDMWFVTTYVLHTIVAHLFRYLVSKAAVKLPLSPESVPVHDH